mmetsp:Transcript_28741/g.55876  ORF Transcript_28741/g.55876 Transcript_28741/m.55876 type:complete len:371 (-) Transcript_28741:89-1201(-)
MQIFITDLNGRSSALEVKGCETVWDLKKKIMDLTGIEESSQLLSANGRQLENSSLLSSHLHTDSCIHLAVAMKGGSGDDDEEEEEASPEEKFQIASYFITQSPPGEVDFVVNDVITLVDDSTILDEKNLNMIMKKHNEDSFVIAEADGQMAIFCAHGDLGDGKYFDPVNKRVLKADYQKMTFSVTSDPCPETKYESYRVAIMDAAKKYLDSSYNRKSAPRTTKKHVVAVYASDSGEINICISAINEKIRASFWSGGWNSQFTVNVASKGDSKLAALVKARVHCFEDGNVQLVSKLDKKDASVTIGEPDATAKAVIAAIEKIENQYQGSMEEMYITLAQSAFKKMRRILPMNQKKMDWRMAAHNVASQMHS